MSSSAENRRRARAILRRAAEMWPGYTPEPHDVAPESSCVFDAVTEETARRAHHNDDRLPLHYALAALAKARAKGADAPECFTSAARLVR